jgi:hypothetical protein
LSRPNALTALSPGSARDWPHTTKRGATVAKELGSAAGMLAMKSENHNAVSFTLDPATFMLAVSILGALVGAIAGYEFDRLVNDRRLLALTAAFFAVAVVSILRRYLGALSPALSLGQFARKVSPYLWLSIGLSSIIGGLAGHDLCVLFQDTSGAVVGFASGVLAAISKSILMVLYFREHPKVGVDF